MYFDREERAREAIQDAAFEYAARKTAMGNKLSQYTPDKEEEINTQIRGILNVAWINETGLSLTDDALNKACAEFQAIFKSCLPKN